MENYSFAYEIDALNTKMEGKFVLFKKFPLYLLSVCDLFSSKKKIRK
jgi:hypothetical protein